MRNLISTELNNKFLLRRADNLIINQVVYNKNFLVNSAKSFKIIKNLIELELLFGQRPKMIASYLRKSLVVNFKITRNSYAIELLPLLQKTPVLWKKYLFNFRLFDYYNVPPYITQKSVITVKINRLSKYQNWLKSAYLD